MEKSRKEIGLFSMSTLEAFPIQELSDVWLRMMPCGIEICFVILLLERQSIVNYSLCKGLSDFPADPLDTLQS